MAKKFQRVFHDRMLTPEEITRDEAVRRQVQKEFPPSEMTLESPGDSLSEAIRTAIRESDKSVYQIAQDANISQIVISRFLSGQRNIRLGTADKLAAVLRVKLAAGS